MGLHNVRLRSHWGIPAVSGPFSQDTAVPGIGFPRSIRPPFPMRERTSKALLGSLAEGNGVVEGFSVNAATCARRAPRPLPPWPASTCMHWQEPRSHRRPVPSALHVAATPPATSSATLFTPALCPLSTPMHSPFSSSHSRAVPAPRTGRRLLGVCV